MYVARMNLSHGACCATGEMCGFALWGPRDLEHWGGTERAQLERIAPYCRDHILKYGYGRQGEYHYGKGETAEEAWNNALRATQDHVDSYSYKGHQLRYFWFVQYRGHDEYENNPLREIVQQLPNVVNLGAFRNANSGNMVDGYLVPFENVNGSEPDEEEEYDD